MFRPLWAVVNGALALLKAAVREAAANTLRDPVTGPAGAVVATDSLDFELDPHAAATSASATSRNKLRIRITVEAPRSQRWWTSPTPPPAHPGPARARRPPPGS